MKVKIFLTILLSVFFATSAFAAPSISMAVSQTEMQGEEVINIYFDIGSDSVVEVLILDEKGTERGYVVKEYEAKQGLNTVTWNGTFFGNVLPTGTYTLSLNVEDRSVHMEVHLTSDAPAFEENNNQNQEEQQEEISEGEKGSQSAENNQTESAPKPHQTEGVMSPNQRSSYTPDHDPKGCYYCTPMDITDEEAVWAVLTAPVTVIDLHQKEQLIIRKEKSEDSEGIGVVTGDSQSVHVLERGDKWSLIECYSSSFHDSKVKAFNAYVTGYVPTSYLKKETPRTDYGMVIDKLTQRLYIFKEGKLFTELLVSTGLYNERQPYNETRSGEFLIVSRVGDFRSDAMICSTALRFNRGDLLHEVPHVLNADKTKNYRTTEYKLGTRASHGCIRVQRLRNKDGVNMAWVWKNIKNGTKLLIWEDYQGRQMPFPADSTPLYYNEKGGSNYHSTENCNGVREKYLSLSPFTYGELDNESYKKLTPCPYCAPMPRKEEIEKINQVHMEQSPGMVNEYHKK